MKLKNCSLQLIKDLYMVKINAVERGDSTGVEHLKNNYPELFDATFLIDVLRNEFEHERGVQNINASFKPYLTNTH
jgi:hypothetical protein